MIHLRSWPLLVAALAVVACSQPEVSKEPDAAAATVAPEPAPEPPTRVAGLPPAAREELKREYRELALRNDCSRSFPDLDGTWRFVGETRTPNFENVITIEGGRFKETLAGDPDGVRVEATITGEIRCLFKNRVLVILDKVEPEGAFENNSGDSYPCDLLGDLAMSGKRMLMICFYDWDVRTAAGMENEYERVVD